MTSSTSDRPSHIYPIVAFGIVTFSISPILVRFAGDAPGLAVAVWRTLFAVAFLAPLAIPRIGKEVRGFKLRDHALILIGGVMLGLHFVTWIESIYHTSVASASVILSTTPIFIAIFGYLLLKEQLTRATVIAILVAVLGAGFIAVGDAGQPQDTERWSLLGNSLALGAALFQCFYLLVGRVIRRTTSWMAYVFPLYTVAALTTLVIALLRGVPLTGYGIHIYLLCGVMALGPQILGHGSFNYAVKYFTAAFLSLLALTEPIGASLMAYVLFDEMPGTLAFVGMMLVLFSVSFALWSRNEKASQSKSLIEKPLPPEA